MPRLGALFVEEPCVFNGDTRFAREHAHKLEVPFVKSALILGKNGHGSDGVVVSDQRNAAEASMLKNGLDAKFFNFSGIVFADKHGLARANNVFGEIVSGRPAARRPQ